jgi:vacuolar-type H+-ATPase subunit E/Vma4
MYCVKKVGDVGQQVGSEIKKQLGSPEFKKAMERARAEQEKARREAEKKLEKALEKTTP